MKVIVPQTDAEIKEHYRIRYETLRMPWGQPPGSERDGEETDNVLASAYNEAGECLGVARMLPLNDGSIQIRSMGVLESARGQGVGKAVLAFLETKAAEMGKSLLVLHARENAVPFYKSTGYRVVSESYVLWGIIPHFKMEKSLKMRTKSL